MGLWENVYPLLLGIGMPKTHTLTIYTHVLLNENQEQLTKKIIPNPDEVSSYCWLNKPILLQQLHSQENILFSGKQYIVENKKLVEKTLDYSSMFNKWLWTQSEPYSGVNFAIRKWLEKVHQEKKSKF